MEVKEKSLKLIDRADNFHWDSLKEKKKLMDNKILLTKLYDEDLSETINGLENQTREALLDSLFSKVYMTTTMSHIYFTYFLKGAPLFNDVYNACLFTSLCIFLHDSTRTQGSTLKEFIYHYSSAGYNKTNSPYYCPPDYPSDDLLNETILLRKQRHRTLKARPVYNKRTEWQAMAVDSEYEWGYKYVIENGANTLYDTFKRIRNLYKDINAALNLERNSDFEENFKKAYKKFLSKLEKIKYENYLGLQKDVYDYLSKNDKYYGINLYRIEKEFRPYIITQEVKQLLACETILDEDAILDRSAILKDICFPKVYNKIASFECISDVENWTLHFHTLYDLITHISCLLIDELVENNRLGEDWYDFLCQRVNELAKEVLHDPNDIDYNVTTKSQEKFMKLLSAAVKKEIYDRTKIILP